MPTRPNFQNSFASSNFRASMESKKNIKKYNESNKNEFSWRNLLLASLFGSLSLTLFIIFALQFRLLDFFEISNLNIKENIFSEIRIKLEGKDDNPTEEFSIFGRKLAMGNGDYFLNIPYALETPRFEQAKIAPLPKDFYAINYGFGCPNGFIRTQALPDLHWNPPPLEIIAAPEQCHTLNIYRCTSSIYSSKNISSSILLIINDGHWLKRSNANFEPSVIIKNLACNKNSGDNGIIVVSINYRMGFYGHFYLPDWSDSKRNFALWDIKTGLEWIQRNIAYFGGNREEITVLASGEGAKLVSLLGIINQGKSLFKRQILISGSLFSPLLFQSNLKNNNDSTSNIFDPSMKFAIEANCLNNNEWNQIKNNNYSVELQIKLEKCLIGLNQQDIISVENKIQFPNLNQWPIITSDESINSSSFYVPENPFSSSSQIPSIIGFCTDPSSILNQKSEHIVSSQMREALHNRVNTAIKDELAENLRKMIDLKKASEEYWGEFGIEELINYYLKKGKIDGILNQFNEEIMKNMEDLIKRIYTDLFIAGPTVLEWLVRTFLFNERVYGFVFEPLAILNISSVDKAEEGARQTNPLASAQPACLEELLLNGVPEEFKEHKVGKAVDDFANRLASFVVFGEPNADEQTIISNKFEGNSIEWPTIFPRLLFNFKQPNNTNKEGQNWPKWLNLLPLGQIESGALDKFLLGDFKLWLCELPKKRFNRIFNNKNDNYINWLC